MVLLIDTNIILDVLLSRSDFVKESSIIWKLCETEQAKGYISTLTYANMMYIMRKQMTPEQIEDVFRKLKLIFEIVDFSSVVLEMAVNMKWKDFEDAIQSATAEYVHVDYIITRNIKDFTQSKVMALTPAELLARIQEKIIIKSAVAIRIIEAAINLMPQTLRDQAYMPFFCQHHKPDNLNELKP